MAGAFPASMTVKKNKYMEEWNGKREITEKTFGVDFGGAPIVSGVESESTLSVFRSRCSPLAGYLTVYFPIAGAHLYHFGALWYLHLDAQRIPNAWRSSFQGGCLNFETEGREGCR